MNNKEIKDRLQNALAATDLAVRVTLLEPVAIQLGNETIAEYVGKINRYLQANAAGDIGVVKSLGSQLSPSSKIGQRYLQVLSAVLAGVEVPEEKKSKKRAKKSEPKSEGGVVSSGAEKPKPKPKTRVEAQCICGCGRTTGSLFAMGHDMKVKGMLRKVQRGEMEQQNLPVGVRDMLVDLVVRWGYAHQQDPETGKVALTREDQT